METELVKINYKAHKDKDKLNPLKRGRIVYRLKRCEYGTGANEYY
jgi:hypothetical protein